MVLEIFLAVFVGFCFTVAPIIHKKSLFTTPTQPLLEGKRGFSV